MLIDSIGVCHMVFYHTTAGGRYSWKAFKYTWCIALTNDKKITSPYSLILKGHMPKSIVLFGIVVYFRDLCLEGPTWCPNLGFRCKPIPDRVPNL